MQEVVSFLFLQPRSVQEAHNSALNCLITQNQLMLTVPCCRQVHEWCMLLRPQTWQAIAEDWRLQTLVRPNSRDLYISEAC